MINFAATLLSGRRSKWRGHSRLISPAQFVASWRRMEQRGARRRRHEKNASCGGKLPGVTAPGSGLISTRLFKSILKTLFEKAGACRFLYSFHVFSKHDTLPVKIEKAEMIPHRHIVRKSTAVSTLTVQRLSGRISEVGLAWSQRAGLKTASAFDSAPLRHFFAHLAEAWSFNFHSKIPPE